ncbi:hypothetical protein BKA65DRAFT_243245 [Rhexocercosporidium sp. MPI-PUGE-AT-0058]|nr:hypothetical protein BKA65DRAFT_243245 [Rhexocercosporidium sp. MPI-PUGE-AT-0058]
MLATQKSQRKAPRSSIRAACDRCHETKSRCARAPGSFECERCGRLGNVCSYSAPLQMGRPKDKSVTQSSGSSPRDHVHAHPRTAPIERKRQSRAAWKTCDSLHVGAINNCAPPPASNLSVSISGPTVIQIDDSQRLICDSWVPESWPNDDFGLSSMLESDYSSQFDHAVTLPQGDFNQLQNTTSLTLSVSDGVQTTNGGKDPSKPPDSIPDPADMSGQGSSGSASDIYDCFHQLLKLQSDLCKFTPQEPSSNFKPSFLPAEHLTTESPTSDNARTSNLDMVLRNTQTLIDILQMPPSSPAPVPHMPLNSSRSLKVHLSSTSDLPTAPASSANHPLDAVTTLLSLSCYSSLLMAYDGLVASLLSSPNNPSDKIVTQHPSLSPSLTFGTFSMTARSSLFVSTVLHLVKQLMEQLQSTFQSRFSLPGNAVSEVVTSLSRSVHSNCRVDEGCCTLGNKSPIFSSVYAILVDISEKEERLMGILAVQR